MRQKPVHEKTVFSKLDLILVLITTFFLLTETKKTGKWKIFGTKTFSQVIIFEFKSHKIVRINEGKNRSLSFNTSIKKCLCSFVNNGFFFFETSYAFSFSGVFHLIWTSSIKPLEESLNIFHWNPKFEAFIFFFLCVRSNKKKVFQWMCSFSLSEIIFRKESQRELINYCIILCFILRFIMKGVWNSWKMNKLNN